MERAYFQKATTYQHLIWARVSRYINQRRLALLYFIIPFLIITGKRYRFHGTVFATSLSRKIESYDITAISVHAYYTVPY